MIEIQEEVPAEPPSDPTRFEIELEFIQSLANPQYVNFLAQNKYLDSQEFLNYLEYLEYWRKPEYAKFLVYPNCLHILSLLKDELFRSEISKADVAKLFMDDFYMKWLNSSNRQLNDTTSPTSTDPSVTSHPTSELTIGPGPGPGPASNGHRQ